MATHTARNGMAHLNSMPIWVITSVQCFGTSVLLWQCNPGLRDPVLLTSSSLLPDCHFPRQPQANVRDSYLFPLSTRREDNLKQWWINSPVHDRMLLGNRTEIHFSATSSTRDNNSREPAPSQGCLVIHTASVVSVSPDIHFTPAQTDTLVSVVYRQNKN